MKAIRIPFNNLRPVHAALELELQEAIARVIRSGWFVLGPELEAFEAEFAAWTGSGYAVGVASGTDAIELALRAAGIGAGDQVITVAHTAVATVAAIEASGATPVLVDIDPITFTIDPAAAAAAITPRTRAIVPVHLYGQAADLTALSALASAHDLVLIEDCAQAHGATHAGRLVGSFGSLAAYSFYPTKNLGGCGDGGAVTTNERRLQERLRSLRNYGQTTRYSHAERGINSRLDELQAAILRVKLRHLATHNDERRRLAAAYSSCLSDVGLPATRAGDGHVFHLYVVRHPLRDAIRLRLEEEGIGTLIHYPVPVHLQPAYRDLRLPPGSLPATEAAAREIISLPLYIGLATADVDVVSARVSAAARQVAS